MFIIAGLQPKRVIVDQTARRCPECGLFQARLQRVDHYLSLFFIPVIRVKKGAPFMHCSRCERSVDGRLASERSWTGKQISDCRQCGRPLRHEFRYCPYCGQGQ